MSMIDVTGKARFARLFEHNRDPGSKKSEGARYDYPEATSIELVLDQDELKKVTKLNPDAKPKITDDGITIKFKRTWFNNIRSDWGGEPKVVDKDGEPWNPQVNIGNDSVCRVVAQVYDTKFGKAHRLMAVQVLELVEYEPEEYEEEKLPF